MRAPGEGPTWTSVERDAAGSYLAAYQRREPGRVVKRKLRYLEADGTGVSDLPLQLAESERRFTLDSSGRFIAVEGRESTIITLPFVQGPPLRVRMATTLAEGQDRFDRGHAGSLARARGQVECVPIRSHQPDAATALVSRDAQLLEGQTTAALLDAARRPQADSTLPERLEALFRRRPDGVEGAVALLRSGEGAQLVATALGTAGTPAATAALLAVAREASLPAPRRVAALAGLMRVKEPPAHVLAACRRILDERDRAVREAAQLAVGALARSIRPRDALASDAAESDLARRYAAAKEQADRVALSGGLGNAASRAAGRTLAGGLADPRPEVRAAAARDLRLVEGSETDGLLARSMTEDLDARVRAAAIFAAGFRREDPFVTPTARAATHDRAEYVRSAAVVLLARMQAGFPDAVAALQRVAKEDPSSTLRQKAERALQEARAALDAAARRNAGG